jgi:hypothetical protein
MPNVRERPIAVLLRERLADGDVDAFRTLGTRFLQMPLGDVERVTLTPVEVPA